MVPPSQSNTHCWHCGHRNPTPPFCDRCGKLQEVPASWDYFAVMGIQATLLLDEKELRAKFHERSWKLHPDRYATAQPPEPFFAQRWATALNKAFQTLREREELAMYVVETFGTPELAASKANVPSELAERYFDLQDSIDPAEWDTFRALVLEKQKEGRNRWNELAKDFEAGRMEPIKNWLDEQRTFESMLKDLDQKRGPASGNRRN